MKILIADDEKAITELLKDALSDEGIECDIVGDGIAAVEKALNNFYDLILLDIMMPGKSGLEVCKKIREKITVPIIFLTAKNRTIDTVLGLELGADDYVKKPFIIEELTAKIKAHIRRSHRTVKNGIYEFDGLKVIADAYEVYLNGKKIDLTSREFQVLMFFIKNVNLVLSREQIYDGVWKSGYGDIGSVTVTIKNLRDKIDSDNRYIKTVWGVGYKFTR